VRLKDRVRAVHKEILLLVVVSLATVPLFLFTREMAALNRQMHARIADVWYQDGVQQLKAQDVDAAIESFRKATTNAHDNRAYRLALVRALARKSNVQEVRLTLLQLRESAPEDGEINLDLARFAARESDVGAAVRYYHSALYGIWPSREMDSRRRDVRAELIDFLLEHEEAGIVLSELLVFSREIPDTPADHIHVGRLFLRAGEPARAADQFARALRQEPGNVEALSGAGTSAYEQGDYAEALQHFQAMGRHASSEEVRRRLNVSRLVLIKDPLAARTSLQTRISRLRSGFEQALQRLAPCAENAGESAGPVLDTLMLEAAAIKPSITVSEFRRDPDLIRTGMNLIYRMEITAEELCGAPDETDEALVLIARMHGVVGNEQSSR
jgi:Tfp pilus assembly protein PilF